ncbi:MAG: hypothetical protein KM296_05175 [Brockia lithotrophica]|nr:hypothetical protein [Brockia lithotrophica]
MRVFPHLNSLPRLRVEPAARSAHCAKHMPPEASVLNPVDVLGDARADRYARAAEILARDPETDGIVAIVCPTATAEPEKTAQVLAKAVERFDLPLTAAFMGGEAMEAGPARGRGVFGSRSPFPRRSRTLRRP